MPNRENELLTSTQHRALDAYRRLSDEKGEPPTVREFAHALGVTHQGAHYLITKLREKGYLSMKPVTIVRPKLTAKARRAK